MRLTFTEHHLFQALKGFDNQHLPLDLFLSHYFRSHKALGSKDRQKIAEAIYGMTRWRSLLDHLIGQHPTWERRYRLYEGLQPSQYLYVNSIPLHIRISCPQKLFELLVKDHGEDQAVQICQVLNTQAPVTVRANPLKTTREALLEKWNPHYSIAPCTRAKQGIVFKKRAPLTALPEFQEGLFEIQDEASQIAASMVAVKPGEHVLDYCAGSGGKSLAIAPQMEGEGQIYLHDIRGFILQQARKRLKRAGIQNGQFLPPHHPQLEKLKKRVDWVLIDAPCSGTGTFRRNPDQKWKFSSDQLRRLVAEQRTIFEKGLSYVRPGGKIVYATCSLLHVENAVQIEHFLNTYPLELVGDPFVSLPTYGGMDGFFTAVLQKTT